MCRCSRRFQCVSNPHQSVSRPQLGTQPEFLKRGSAHDPRERRTNRQNASFGSTRHARANVVFTVFLRGMSLQGLEYRSDSRRYGVPSHVVFFHCSNSTTKRRRVWGTPHTSSSISSHSSRGSVYALGVTTCSCGFVLGSSSSTISQPRRASPLGVMPIMSA